MKIASSLLPFDSCDHQTQFIDDVLGLELEKTEKLVLRDLCLEMSEGAEVQLTRLALVKKFIGDAEALSSLSHLDISKNRIKMPQLTTLVNNLAKQSQVKSNLQVLKIHD